MTPQSNKTGEMIKDVPINEEWEKEFDRDLETERLITGKNQHSVIRWCARHGFGCHGPGEDICPSCGQRCMLYLSGEDVRQLIKQARIETAERFKHINDSGYSIHNAVSNMRFVHKSDVEDLANQIINENKEGD